MDLALLGGPYGALPPARTIRLNLLTGADFTATLERFEQTSSGYAWIGRPVDEAQGFQGRSGPSRCPGRREALTAELARRR